MNNQVEVQVSGAQGMVPCTYKTVVLKPNILDDKNILTQAMMNKPNTKYIIKYDFIISDNIVTKSVNVVSTNVSHCGNAAYAQALADYNAAHEAWIVADNAYTNNPNDTTLAAKNVAYDALQAAQLTLNGTPQYYYFAGTAIRLKRNQHITIPEGCVLLNSSLNGVVDFTLAPNDVTVYIGSAVTGTYEYTIQAGIEIPVGCLIGFDGGSISDGVLVGNNTILIYDQEEEDVFKNVSLEGSFERSTSAIADKMDNTNGMAKIYLKKNKPLATQLTQPNTIYVIQYDFTLDEDITIPANCVLEFDGGSISGRTLEFNNTLIIGANKSFKEINLTGTIINDTFYSSWIDMDISGNSLITDSVQQMFNVNAKRIVFDSGNYAFNKVTVKNSCVIEGAGNSKPKLIGQPQVVGERGCDNLFFAEDIDSVTIRNLEITADIGDLPATGLYNKGLILFVNLRKAILDDIYFNKVHLSKMSAHGKYLNNAILVMLDSVKYGCVKNCEFNDTYGGEQVQTYPNDDNDCVFEFDHNYVHDITEGNSIVTAEAGEIRFTNNKVDGWHLTMSVCNLHGQTTVITNNIVVNSETYSVFDMTEWGALKIENLIATDNYVESKNSVVFVSRAHNINVANNIVKGLCLIGNYSTEDEANNSISITDNIIDATYFDSEVLNDLANTGSAISLTFIDPEDAVYSKYKGVHSPMTNILIDGNNIKFKHVSQSKSCTLRYRTAIKTTFGPEDNIVISNNNIEGNLDEYYSYSLPVLLFSDDKNMSTLDYNTKFSIVGNSIKNNTNKVVCIGLMTYDNRSLKIGEMSVDCVSPLGLQSNNVIINTLHNIGNALFTMYSGYAYICNGQVNQKCILCLMPKTSNYLDDGNAITQYYNYGNYALAIPKYNNSVDTGTAVSDGAVIDFEGSCVLLVNGNATLGTSLASELSAVISGSFNVLTKVGNNYWLKVRDNRGDVTSISARLQNFSGSTRPVLTNGDKGFMFFDASLGKPIWYNGNNVWVDATGATV